MTKSFKKLESNISYYAKKPTACPVCKNEFPREDMLSGGGRMIAGDLTDELRRTYEPSAKYGPVYPLMYTVGVCPECFTAFFWSDFTEITEADTFTACLERQEKNKAAVAAVFPYYDFNRARTLLDGAAAHFLALLCYENAAKSHSPTTKQGILALRLAWLSGDMNRLCPGRNYDYVQQVFYRKALFFYTQALEYEAGDTENFDGIANFGPDIDKNYGYTGVLYLACLLELKYGQREDMPVRLQTLGRHKRNIAKVFGLGKASKNKPLPLLEHARALYDNIKKDQQDANMPDLDLDFEDDEQA
ncbi:MAG: DUF2225 domain-containing protein [Treponema sp.]|jgi:uncharacterized protein (DUF2225 family)|nr:DUF2225 domain-containing protein [Treponema sp.]